MHSLAEVRSLWVQPQTVLKPTSKIVNCTCEIIRCIHGQEKESMKVYVICIYLLRKHSPKLWPSSQSQERRIAVAAPWKEIIRTWHFQLLQSSSMPCLSSTPMPSPAFPAICHALAKLHANAKLLNELKWLQMPFRSNGLEQDSNKTLWKTETLTLKDKK